VPPFVPAADPPRNRDRALCYFHLPIRARPPEADVIEHVKTRVNIANAYLDRVRGGPPSLGGFDDQSRQPVPGRAVPRLSRQAQGSQAGLVFSLCGPWLA